MGRYTTRGRVRATLVLVALTCASPVAGAPLERADVPEPLRPWVEWVLQGHEARACPALAGSGALQCVWPTRLELQLEATAGRFEQQFFVDAESTVLLPGGPEHWPERVRVDGRAAAVVAARDQRPSLRLSRGRHRVEGRFVWRELPQLLPIPPDTGLVALTLEGETVPFPSRDAQGRLWLRERAAREAVAEDHLEVEVHRQVVDEIPLRLVTRIDLRVSGQSREEILGRALPEGFVPLALGTAIPARLEPDGRIRVQVRPGRWGLVLEARHEGPVAELALPARGEDSPGAWDASEVWVFSAQPWLRLVEVEGPASVDPTQTELPQAWRALPAYRMAAGDRMQLVEKRRGNAGPARDELHLRRSWHVDFDGRGATVADQIQGTMRASARLEMGEATRLGRAAVNGSDQPITTLGGEGVDDAARAGIEVPLGAIQLDADSRVEESARRLPAVGWHHDFASLEASLQLPPGWQLFHVTGADRATSTWIGRWTLLDLFLVMVIAMAFLRLFGPAVGGLAGLTLALSYTEGGAPQLVWVAVLASEALGRVVPAGRLATLAGVARVVSLAALVLLTVPFVAHQIRVGLFPALERPWAMVTERPAADEERPLQVVREADQVRSLERNELETKQLRGLGYVGDAPETPSEPRAAASGGVAFKRGRAASSPARAYSYAPDPDARIPTGPGRPDWQWETVQLEWSGPVERGQQLRLWLVPPWAVALLAMIRSGLLLGLVGFVVARAGGLASRWSRTPGDGGGLGRAAAGAGAAALALLLALPGARPAAAEIPSPELLEELRSRLLERPECHPSCVSMAKLALRVGPSRITARLEVAVAEETALPLPGGGSDAAGFVPERVLVDGTPAEGLLRTPDGRMWLRLARGTHQVELGGALPPGETVELPLPWRPHRVEVVSDGWTVQGLREDGRVEGALQLVREDTGAELETLEVGRVAPFVRVTRDVRLDLSWQVHTSVERVAPQDGAIVIEVPLLPGESVTTADVQVKEGRALVSLQPGARSVRWSGVLPVTPSLHFAAPPEAPWSEVWRVDASPLWHTQAEGIPSVETQAQQGQRLREWRPWPGETLSLQVTRPDGVAGSTATIDSSRLTVRPGLRSTQSTLSLKLRSSQGGAYAVTLPEGAELHSIQLNGREQPIRQEGREVPLTLVPGTQAVALDWREPRGVGLVTRAPEVDLGLPSVNHHAEIVMPRSRWTLWTSGPRLGPAVLFWPVLGLLAALAVVLGRVRSTPLRVRHWFLLGLGLTQVPVLASGSVVAWILALGWRRQLGATLDRDGMRAPLFDLMQLSLVALTLAALAALFWSIQNGLLGLPEMQISGNGSNASLLRWYQDRADAVLPRPAAGSVSLWFYRLAMLAWSLWVAQALVGWLRWGWQCLSAGALWRPLRRRRPGLETG